jgi:hypothetical protein
MRTSAAMIMPENATIIVGGSGKPRIIGGVSPGIKSTPLGKYR